MDEDTIEFELLGIPVYFKIDYFKKIVEKCCDDKEEHANYMLAVGCGFGLGKNPQRNYNNTVNKIRTELLNILLHDCDSIFNHSIINNGFFSKFDKRLPSIVGFSLRQFRDRSSCIDFSEQGNTIHVDVYKRRNPLQYITGQKKIHDSFDINLNNVQLLFGKHSIGKFFLKTEDATYIFTDGKVYGSYNRKN